MSVITSWTEKTFVTTSEVDFQQRLKASSFFRMMQETASFHAAHLGYQYEEMFARNLAWVLSRAKIKFFQFPLVGEKVTIQTWLKGIRNKIFFMRDFIFQSEDNSRLAASTSAYLLIDTRTRHFLPPQKFLNELLEYNHLDALDDSLDKINPPENMPEVFNIQVGYNSIDLLGHVTNARYIEWIGDCFSLEEYQSGYIDWMQINFLSEVKAGEKVSLCRQRSSQENSICLIQGKNLTTGKTAFESSLNWKRS